MDFSEQVASLNIKRWNLMVIGGQGGRILLFKEMAISAY